MQYHLIVMVLAEYSCSYSLFADVGNIYFDLAQAQQHFQSIVHSHLPHNVQQDPN